eukprot:2624890-Alexandrium_andersonii.AAC.1
MAVSGQAVPLSLQRMVSRGAQEHPPIATWVENGQWAQVEQYWHARLLGVQTSMRREVLQAWHARVATPSGAFAWIKRLVP